MNTLKDFLNKLEAESKEREEDDLNDYEALAMEIGIQNTIKDIRSWLEEHSFSQKVNDLESITLVRVE